MLYSFTVMNGAIMRFRGRSKLSGSRGNQSASRAGRKRLLTSGHLNGSRLSPARPPKRSRRASQGARQAKFRGLTPRH